MKSFGSWGETKTRLVIDSGIVRRESVKREKTLCPSNQGKLSQRIRTKIKYDSLDRVVLRIDYRDDALVAKSIYEYRNP